MARLLLLGAQVEEVYGIIIEAPKAKPRPKRQPERKTNVYDDCGGHFIWDDEIEMYVCEHCGKGRKRV